jgi:hypothetical protein
MDQMPRTTNKAALHDLILYLLSLHRCHPGSYSALRWGAAFKVTASLQILLRDYKILSRESLLFRDVLRQLE